MLTYISKNFTQNMRMINGRRSVLWLVTQRLGELTKTASFRWLKHVLGSISVHLQWLRGIADVSSRLFDTTDFQLSALDRHITYAEFFPLSFFTRSRRYMTTFVCTESLSYVLLNLV
jgi:hypothetical protein